MEPIRVRTVSQLWFIGEGSPSAAQSRIGNVVSLVVASSGAKSRGRGGIDRRAGADVAVTAAETAR